MIVIIKYYCFFLENIGNIKYIALIPQGDFDEFR